MSEELRECPVCGSENIRMVRFSICKYNVNQQ